MTRLNNTWYDFSNEYGVIRHSINSISLHSETVAPRVKRYFISCSKTHKQTRPMTAHKLTVLMREALDNNNNILGA